MNIVFLIGKVFSNVNFKFIVESKYISVAWCDVKMEDNNIIRVKGYNDIADYLYGRMNVKDYVLIKGFINNDGILIIENIEKL